MAATAPVPDRGDGPCAGLRAIAIGESTGAAVAAMVDNDPFRGVDTARLTRFVAMLGDNAPPAEAMPDPAPDAGYGLVERGDRDLYFVIDRERAKTPDVMVRLDRAFAKAVTTRNWSTMERVATVIGEGSSRPPL
jgi:hypothetical protein